MNRDLLFLVVVADGNEAVAGTVSRPLPDGQFLYLLGIRNYESSKRIYNQRFVFESFKDVVVCHARATVFDVVSQLRDVLHSRVPFVTALETLQQRLLTDFVALENSPAMTGSLVDSTAAFSKPEFHVFSVIDESQDSLYPSISTHGVGTDATCFRFRQLGVAVKARALTLRPQSH